MIVYHYLHPLNCYFKTNVCIYCKTFVWLCQYYNQ
uniref:Uncharacterized protein n=1 Tax=Siphoviridae sp. cto6l14 TaxID=2827590 RepID=A0A8S5LP41_9CAUD|nr:MAG TPA: hypothetical protein [Siphoviridae sp. cto6l14]